MRSLAAKIAVAVAAVGAAVMLLHWLHLLSLLFVLAIVAGYVAFALHVACVVSRFWHCPQTRKCCIRQHSRRCVLVLLGVPRRLIVDPSILLRVPFCIVAVAHGLWAVALLWNMFGERHRCFGCCCCICSLKPQ